jgi:nucleoside-diphosphate-sugar epimerase
MRIFITGATGFIGSAVAAACRRAGHEVYGLVRTPERAQGLLRNEIHPVVGDLENHESYLDVVWKCSVMIHTAANRAVDQISLDMDTVEALLKTGKEGAQPKTLIYTSGTWVHGNTNCEMVDETAPLMPLKLVGKRPATERMVLESPAVKGLVVRPALVYGKQGGLTGTWFQAAYKDKAVKMAGDGNNHLAMVHVEDLADCYLRVAESGLSGEIFLTADGSCHTMREMVTAAAQAAGYRGEIESVSLPEAIQVWGAWSEGLALDQHIDSGKARRMLRWQPRHRSFADEATAYFRSWAAYQT